MPATGAERSITGEAGGTAASPRTRTLSGACLAHALHDGYSDLIYVLLPVWQAQFGLGYVALAALRTLAVGALAALQMPATRLAQRAGTRTVLIAGTLLSAGGYALAGASGGLAGLCLALLLAGAGGSTQHPLASSLVSRAYGTGARGPLGTYNFAGDLGKAAIPPLVALLMTWMDWRAALWLVSALGVMVALGLAGLLPRDSARPRVEDGTVRPRAEAGVAAGERRSTGGFGLLVAIGMLDNAARPAFLLYLPFLLQEKGAALTTVGLAFSLVAVGGALGKAACGWIAAHYGPTRAVVATEAATALLIGAVLVLPLGLALAVLPLLGVMLNGTSSALYGTVPELAPGGNLERAFAVFYTCTLGGSALTTPLLYGRLGDLVGPHGAAAAAAATALAVIPLALLLGPRLRGRSGTVPA